MINSIIKFALNNKLFILLGSLLILIFGLRAATDMDIDVFPDLTAPTVVIITDAHGMAPEEIERLVTFPIETVVNGANDVRRVRSTSSQGFSFVWVEFDWGTDIFKARQTVSEKLITINSAMPIGVGQPTLVPQSSVMGEIFFIGIYADSTDLMKLRTIVEWDIKPLLLAVGGVSQITIIGGDYKQYHVLANSQKMKYYNVSMSELFEVCKGISQNSTGGVLRQYGNEYIIRGMARTSDLEDLGNSFVKFNNEKPVRVNDVASVEIGTPVKLGYASRNATPAVIISVSKQPNINTLQLTQKIEENLKTLQKTLPEDVVLDTKIFRQADFIETSISNVANALIEGSIFVIIVLILFLGNFRTTIISLIAIPLSLLGTILVMKYLGFNINTMSLGGMAIAIGSLVDDAIIDVENVYKRLQQNLKKPVEERASSFVVVFEASKEIRASIFNATLIIIVAFTPLFFLSGMEGRMLQPLGVSFIVSLFISLVVAMTLTPVLTMMLLSNEKYLVKNEKKSWLVNKLVYYYEKSLLWSLNYKKTILLLILFLFIVSLITFTTMGRSLLPEFNEGSYTLSVVTRQGSSLEDNNMIGNLVETELLAIPEIISTARRTGRDELDEHSQTTNTSEIDVNFVLKDRSSAELTAEVRETLNSISGIAVTVGQPLGHRIDHMLSGTRANIAIKLFGYDLNKMFIIGNQIKNAIIDVEGLVDLNVDQQIEIPQIQIKANREMLAKYGITIEQFNEFIEIAFNGKKATDIYEGERRFDLVVRLDKNYTESIEGIRSVLIDTYNGKKVPLEQVADIVSLSGPSAISRENVHRKVVIAANVAGRDLRSVVRDIQKQINDNISLPEGYRIEYGGQFESEAKASQTLMLTLIVAIFIIFLLLYQEFKSLMLAGIIMLNLPLALIGGVYAIFFTSAIISIPAIIGFITLFGIATRNGILLISNYQKLEASGEPLFNIIKKGSIDRLNPILMTAMAATFALIPLALRGNMAGNEIQSPMAKVILGGLLTSTFLNIYIIPIVYNLIKTKFKNEKIIK